MTLKTLFCFMSVLSVQLHFDSREEAISHAERNGWKYVVMAEATEEDLESGWREYEHNFLSQRVRKMLISQSKKPVHFNNPNYGELLCCCVGCGDAVSESCVVLFMFILLLLISY